MPIKTDRSSLPSGGDDEGFPPVAEPHIVHLLAQKWYEDSFLGDDHPPSADWWASMSGMCARSVGYSIVEGRAKRRLRGLLSGDVLPEGDTVGARELDIENAAMDVQALAATNPPTIAAAWRMGLGSLVHDQLQKVLVDLFPDAEIEVRVQIEDFGSARADAIIRRKILRDTHVTLLELKTMNGFAYKLAVSKFKGAPEGPKRNAIVQGAVAARAVDADLLIIGVLSMENVGDSIAKSSDLSEIQKFAAEWHYTREQYLPYAEQEIKRVRKIIEIVDEGALPPRHHPEIPAGARITNPATGLWSVQDDDGNIVMSGNAWVCDYCWNRDRCIADGAS